MWIRNDGLEVMNLKRRVDLSKHNAPRMFFLGPNR